MRSFPSRWQITGICLLLLLLLHLVQQREQLQGFVYVKILRTVRHEAAGTKRAAIFSTSARRRNRSGRGRHLPACRATSYCFGE